MTPTHCLLLALEVLKWLSEKHQSSEKGIYFQTPLFVPSLKLLWRDFSIDTMPQDLSRQLKVLHVINVRRVKVARGEHIFPLKFAQAVLNMDVSTVEVVSEEVGWEV